MHWRVPQDDTHAQIFWLNLTNQEAADGRDEMVVLEQGPWLDDRGEYPLNSFPSQDTMAWETQGPIFDRSEEHLGASDGGIFMFRRMVREAIKAVQRGENPQCPVRDVEDNELIDLRGWFWEGDPVAGDSTIGVPQRSRNADEIFDDRHLVFEVPYGKARPRV